MQKKRFNLPPLDRIQGFETGCCHNIDSVLGALQRG
jgi:hypothetical protein